MTKPICCPRCKAMLDVELDEENPFVQCSQCQIVFTHIVESRSAHSGYVRQIPVDFDSMPAVAGPRLTFHRPRSSFANKIVFVGLLLFFACVVCFIFGQRQIQRSLYVSDLPFGVAEPHSYQISDKVWAAADVTITTEGRNRTERMTFEAGVDPQFGLSMLHLAPEVREIDLSGTQLTDLHLYMLAGRTDLRLLHLNDTQVTDKGIEQLAQLTELESLNLKNCAITDAALEVIACFTLLEELGLSETEVTDEGLTRIGALVRLKKLYLGDTQAGDVAAASWSWPMSLEVINLGDTKLGDEGLQHLSNHRSMTYLNLAGTRVTDAGIKHLSSLERLEGLNLGQTKVTSQGIDELRSALPRSVIWDKNP